MKRLIFFYLSLLALNANAEIWIVKAPSQSSKSNFQLKHCTYNTLNPHLGADIFQVICPLGTSFLDGEKSVKWKVFDLDQVPNDPELKKQWALDAINIRSFWQNFSTGDRHIKVAIIDTGVDYLHQDLQANIAINDSDILQNGIDEDGNGYIDDHYGWDSFFNTGNPMDNFNHGTHVAGIIAASTNNSLGISGMNWNISIIPIKFTDQQGEGSTESAIRAIDYAVTRNAKIINASWGGTTRSPLLEEVIARTEAKGILFIAAAGNETVDNDNQPTYPANYSLDNIISVAAMDDHKDLSWFSNWGKKSVHVAAPGESILSTTKGYKQYGYKDGTSMAAPHITGAAALLWAAHPDWNYLQVKDYILGHCQVDKLKIIPVQCQGYFSF